MFDLYKNIQIGDVTSYIRPYQTLSYSPLNGLNSLTISEEQILILPDSSTINVPLGTADIQATITDPTQSFDLVDPTTGTVIGSKTFAQLKVELYSLYLYLAALRDEAP